VPAGSAGIEPGKTPGTFNFAPARPSCSISVLFAGPKPLSKSLIIAEKPSVAGDIAKALGGFTRHDDYFESDKAVLSSAVGHLLEIGMPEEEEVKRGKWTFAHLPAVPSKFALKPIEKNENRLKTLLKLMKRKDVTTLINACDAGREGELIFRYIAQYAKTNKPIKRLWLQSMTPAAIRDGFAALRSDATMLPLADAAVCRSEADWLVGINGTRAMTAFNSKSGGFQLTTVGRVQTPTLAILVEREAKIRAFVPRNYWEVIGTFRAASGEYQGRWFDEKWKKIEDDPDARAERLFDEARAQGIAAKCAGKPGTVTEESKPATQSPPLLYDLTSLQREANGRFGFSARTTLSLAQALYEKHKVLTYPRTDARALPEDYIGTVNSTLEELAETNAFGGFAREILKRKWVGPNKRIFDNSKISDHFAIIPTLVRPKNLNEIEGKLYELVVRRFLAVFYPAAEHLVTTRITRVAGEPFKTEGKVLVTPGWLAVYGREAQGDEASLVPVRPDEKVATEKVEAAPLVTRPPPRYNEATLLSAMEGAGKLIEDDELREAMREKGLGTPATRAAIIEGLIAERYVHREGKELTPTAKAFSLMTLLHGLGIPELFSPELTAEWEFKLAQMEHGNLPRDTFMREIVAMTEKIVGQAKNYESDTIPGDFATLTNPCPKCGGEVHEKYKKFQCENPKCDFAFWKIMGGRQIEPQEADALIKNRTIGPLEGFRSKMGRPFSAVLKLNDAIEVVFDFGNADAGDDGEPPDFSQSTTLGACPKCGARVFEHGSAYVCEKAVGPEKTCDFRSGRMILQRPIEPEQMRKLLASKKTDLLHFISARTRRAFSAYLVVQKDGKVGFEFEAKDPSKSRGTRGRAAALRVLGAHPRTKAPVELHSGRFGPYVKHGNVNATLPDREQVDTITLEDALALLAAKDGKGASADATRAKPAAKRAARAPTKTAAPASVKSATARATAKPATKAAGAAKTAAKKPAAKKPAAKKSAAKRKSA
jgi:DNA topoisomerase-3